MASDSNSRALPLRALRCAAAAHGNGGDEDNQSDARERLQAGLQNVELCSWGECSKRRSPQLGDPQKRQAVKLGIDAPESVRVWRDAGDCFARRSFSHRTDDIPAALSDDGPATDADGEHPAATDRGKRILLADDDAGHVTLIKRALRRANTDCTVDVVRNGVEAIDYLLGRGDFADRQPTEMPDLMLLDLNMPEMNGLQVLQVLRNARRQGQERLTIPPVVVLTSSDEDADVNDSYNLGAQSFIRKPVDHGRFAHAVQQTTQYWLSLNESLSDEPSRRMSVPR